MKERKIIEKAIYECFKSKDMADYLIKELDNLNKVHILDLIAKAAIPLKRKWEILKELSSYETGEEKKKAEEVFNSFLIGNESEPLLDNAFRIINTYSFYTLMCECGINELENPREDEIFQIEFCSYDEYLEKDFRQNSYAARPCLNLNEAKKILYYNLTDPEEDMEKNRKDAIKNGNWVELQKYKKTGDHLDERLVYTFYFDEPCWFSIEENYYQEHQKRSAINHLTGDLFSLDTNLYLPTPFEIGDLIEVDYRPFGPKIRTIVIEKLNNYDCCEPQCMTFDKDLVVSHGALKHSHFFDEYLWPLTSSLYTAKKISAGDLTDEDYGLKELSKYVKDKESGHKLDSMLHDIPFNYCEKITLNELVDAMKNEKEFKISLDDERPAPDGYDQN